MSTNRQYLRGSFRIQQRSASCFAAQDKSHGGNWFDIGIASDLAGAEAMLDRYRKQPKPKPVPVVRDYAQEHRDTYGASWERLEENLRNGERMPEPEYLVRGDQSRPLGGSALSLLGFSRTKTKRGAS